MGESNRSTCLSFIPTEEERSWLQGSLVGSLKGSFSWIINGKDIQQEVAKFCQVSYLGGDLMLITNVPGGTLMAHDPSFKTWLEKWFDYVGKWNDKISNKKRVI